MGYSTGAAQGMVWLQYGACTFPCVQLVQYIYIYRAPYRVPVPSIVGSVGTAHTMPVPAPYGHVYWVASYTSNLFEKTQMNSRKVANK